MESEIVKIIVGGIAIPAVCLYFMMKIIGRG